MSNKALKKLDESKPDRKAIFARIDSELYSRMLKVCKRKNKSINKVVETAIELLIDSSESSDKS